MPTNNDYAQIQAVSPPTHQANEYERYLFSETETLTVIDLKIRVPSISGNLPTPYSNVAVLPPPPAPLNYATRPLTPSAPYAIANPIVAPNYNNAIFGTQSTSTGYVTLASASSTTQ